MNQIVPFEAFIARRTQRKTFVRTDAVACLLQDLSRVLKDLMHQAQATQTAINSERKKLALREGQMRKLDEAYKEAINASSLEEMERARDRYKLLHDQFYRER